MNEQQNVEFIWKFLLAIAGSIFSIAIAIAVQQIRLKGVPRSIIVAAILVQLLLSWGVFIFMMLLFKSSLLPDAIPNDDWTALLCAYGFSAIPNLIVATAILIYNKEVDKWLKDRYDDAGVPSMQKYENITTESQKDENQEAENQEEEESHFCETCNQRIEN